MRPSRGYSGRILPFFKKGTRNPRARGLVTSGFMEGLGPAEFMMHAMGARDSTVAKTLVTPTSGYMYRRLLNAMQDFYVASDLSVRDVSGSLVQTIYGGDGVDPTKELLAREREKK
jgi:DNA-directed RNA polymerase beta' subunit